ncbi:Metallo-dependent phosphatase-like protein [Haematococcus lacustris]
MKLALLLCRALLCGSLAAAAQMGGHRRMLITEVGGGSDLSRSVPCNQSVLGSYLACWNASIKAPGNVDYPWGAPEISYPTDGTPWGAHITGPYPDGSSYLVSWFSGDATTGAASGLNTSATNSSQAQVTAWPLRPAAAQGAAARGRELKTWQGRSLAYSRVYTAAAAANYSYLSPAIYHVLLSGLEPRTTYGVKLGGLGRTTPDLVFTTLADRTVPRQQRYPLRVGLIADVGQTANSSVTQTRLVANRPDVILHVGDNTYADIYGPMNFEDSPLPPYSSGTNQKRWDSHASLWATAFNSTPVLNCIGNHEIEDKGITAAINYTVTSFAFPSNYPFQSYAARWPVPGTKVQDLGNIDRSLYYSTVVGGVVKLVTLNNYIPFHAGTPQHRWAMVELLSVDRSATPWLVVQFHAPIYHSYYTHYKEQECFRSVYEDLFYAAQVDLVLSGHVHAYERSHGVYDYKRDNCAPMHVVIGDGGNTEGPYRNFVDEVSPLTNKTYCEMLKDGAGKPPDTAPGASSWGPDYQRAAHPPGCPTTSWQPAHGIAGGPPLVLQKPRSSSRAIISSSSSSDSSSNSSSEEVLGFCQSSQPKWSAYRDPSFGHAILNILGPNTAELAWYRNIDSSGQPADTARLERLSSCMDGAGRHEALARLKQLGH